MGIGGSGHSGVNGLPNIVRRGYLLFTGSLPLIPFLWYNYGMDQRLIHSVRRYPNIVRSELNMENVNKVVPANVSLATLRQEVADAVKRAYGAERAYAVALNTQFGFDWFEVEASDVSESAKPVHAEKGELFKVLKEAKHSNPSTVWARIRKYGRDEKYPRAEGEGGEGEGEGGNSQAGTTRTPMLRNVEELTALYKFNARQESLPEQVKKAQTFIVSALRELGVDVSLIK